MFKCCALPRKKNNNKPNNCLLFFVYNLFNFSLCVKVYILFYVNLICRQGNKYEKTVCYINFEF